MEKPFLEAMHAGGLVADGAMGSLLYQYGVYVNRNFDEVNLSQPELVAKIHRQYIEAGAHVVETNTYGANRIRLARHGLAGKTEAINRAAVSIALSATSGTAYVMGAIGPTGLTPGDIRRNEDEVRRAFAEQAEWLADAGCHALLIETFASPSELRLALEGIRPVVEIPLVAEFQVNGEGQVVDGTDPLELAQEMRTWGADVVGVNCNAPDVIFEVATELVKSGLDVCAMPNAGRPQNVEDRLIYLATPENFGVFARRMYKAGVKMVGGCCGTQPAHIQKVAAASRMVFPGTRVASVVHESAVKQPVHPLAERSRFGKKLAAGEFVVSVEVNAKSGLDVASTVSAAKMLVASGADVINIADGPRASARMSNLAPALEIQREVGCEVLLHMCCRDHNLLGLQAHALGGHVLGVRNLVVITGDPPKMGDFPDATAVYDVDSIGLLKILNDMNRGQDASGRSMDQTDFVLITGAEPAAVDFEREVARLELKVHAGAEAVMTQPVYERDTLLRFLDAIAHLKVPVLVGVLPLASHRNAEFLHHHVPGMRIPESVRARFAEAASGEASRALGVEIASDLLNSVKDRVQGAYLMPPLGRYDMAAQILSRVL